MYRIHPHSLFAAALTLTCAGNACAQTLPAFDFTQAAEAQAWQATHHIASLDALPEGMAIRIDGFDPYTNGPARDYPADMPLWMHVRLKSEQSGTAQVFYFARGTGPSEEHSIRFNVKGGDWVEAKVPLPALGPATHLRLDPPGTAGTCVVASIRFSPRVLHPEPQWPKPVRPALAGRVLTLSSGPLAMRHGQELGFVVSVAGREMAVGLSNPLIGYLQEGQVRWLDLAAKAKVTAAMERRALRVEATADDADGATWRITRRFTAGRTPGAIDVETQVSVSRERTVLFLPMLALLPGAGSFGEARGQGLFAGLEYLDKEDTSSSEADIIGPGSHRQVPDTEKITFPLMAVQAQDRTIGLIWEPASRFCALFDSPDRTLKSGGHLMGVLFPGSDGTNRVEGSLLPYDGETIAPGKPLVLRASLIGGEGKSILPAVKQYVALRGLPPLPDAGLDVQGYCALAAGGWMDSKLKEADRFRHAYWPGNTSFGPQPAADAALWLDWIAGRTKDATLAGRARQAAQAALAQVPPANYNGAGVGHVRYPAPALLFGGVAENAARARDQGRALLGRFEKDGSILYRKSPDRPDYGKTHFAPDANGLTAQVVEVLLTCAAVSGDADLIREGLIRLRALDKFDNSVPRGAQTWECPLHTPDILASAHLVRAYTLGYELSGDRQLLDRAIEWAWTGVPFVYLVNPTGQPVGPYATIAVLGATNWVAPNWMGMPVQWCGLVYSDALYRLVRHDPAGPWKRIADGIALSGIQQTYPRDDADLQGLLPDSYNLRPQTRNGPAINPATVQANAARLFTDRETYDFHAFRQAGLFVHAPGSLTDARESRGGVTFTVRGWPAGAYYVLVSGLKRAPAVRADGKGVSLREPHQYLEKEGWLILKLQGEAKVELRVRE